MITNTQVPGNDLVLKQGAMRDIDSLSVVGYDNDSTLYVHRKMKHGEFGIGNVEWEIDQLLPHLL